MKTNRKLVEDFYYKIWNEGNEVIAHKILSPTLKFRGSTGPIKNGIDDFLDYVRLIRKALGDYECIIDSLVTEGEKTFAKMTFRGKHIGLFFGVEPTKRMIAWDGAALFCIRDNQICNIWVLGDIDNLKQQLGLADKTPP